MGEDAGSPPNDKARDEAPQPPLPDRDRERLVDRRDERDTWPDPDTRDGDCDHQDTQPPSVQAPPGQVLTGTCVGMLAECRVWCAGCRRDLREGESVAVYAYRAGGCREWDMARCYCEACQPDHIVGPTLGTTEVLATALLGTRSMPATRTHRLCLDEVTPIQVSPPTEGAAP